MATRPGVGIPTVSKRSKRVLIVLGVLAALAVLWFQFVSVYVDYLWYGEVGYRQVFTTQVTSRIIMFLIAGIGSALLVFLALYVAYRSRPVFVPTANEVDPLAPYRTVVTARPKLFAIGIPVLVGVICGLSAQSDWTVLQMWLHGTDFGTVDPQFGNDVGFYVFTLPFYEMLLGWLFVITAVCFIAVLVTQYLFGGIRFSGPGRRITSQATLQLSLLVGFFVLIKAVQYWFDRYGLLFSDRSGIFTGANYTDVNAVLPAKIILMCIAVICAVGFFVGAFLRSVKLPAVALALLVLSSVLIGGVWPLVLQKVVVNPNGNSKEPTYIARNIEATRAAYGIDAADVTYEDYQGTTSGVASDVLNDQDTVPNARLLDPNVLSPTFTQQQQLQNWYGFPEQLSVDRYTIDGVTRDYVVAARQLNSAGLAGGQTDWIQRHMVFTHGDGFVAAPANEVVDGYPAYAVSDVSNIGKDSQVIKVDQPRIYYGALTTDYAIVGQEGATPPRERETDGSYYTYQGSGGVPVGNLFQRLVFATAYTEMNFLFSSGINDNSKIIFKRDPRDRVAEVAPFLTTDTKPYPAVVDGRIVWIVDAYTTATNYPYAQAVTLEDATTNSLTARGAAQQADRQVSYMRNSVKATVDAYDGTVTLYQVDEDDPVLKAWEGVFPGLVRPGEEVSDELRAHFRYPEDIFEVQRNLLVRYNVDNAVNFFNNAGFWKVPGDPTTDPSLAQPPYYLQVRMPGEEDSEFQLTSVLTGYQREFMAAYMAASSDPENYGKITVLRLPATTQTPGPAQVQTLFRTTQEVSERVTLSQQQGGSGSRVIFGNLLTLPVNDGLLYVEPFYIQGGAQSASQYPQLSWVLVWYANKVGVAPTLEEALRKAAPVDVPGDGDGTTTTDPTTPPATGSQGVPGTTTAPGTTGGVPATEAEALQAMEDALQELNDAKQAGDLGRIGEATEALEKAVGDYLALGGGVGLTTSSAPASPTTAASGG